MVTSVGYRVKSKRGVQFRKWANRILKEYLVKGYAVTSIADAIEAISCTINLAVSFFVIMVIGY